MSLWQGREEIKMIYILGISTVVGVVVSDQMNVELGFIASVTIAAILSLGKLILTTDKNTYYHDDEGWY